MHAAPTSGSDRLPAFEAALSGQLDGVYRADAASRALYATDASMYEVVPLGVVLPRSADDVAATVSIAARFGIPILARGGGSSLAGQTVNEAVVLDFTPHLNRVLESDASAGRVRVQPGITLEALNASLAGTGWMVGPDPASGSRATLGGMMANNATGTHSILYGNMIRHVSGAGVVLADGTVTRLGNAAAGGDTARLGDALAGIASRYRDAIAAMPSHWRRANGYRLEILAGEDPNLAKLICGSEGTLAVATDLTVDLVRRPAHTSVGVVHFETRSEALRSVTRILDTAPSAVELFDGSAIRQCRTVPSFADRMSFVEGDPGAVLLTEYYGDTAAEVHAALDRLEAVMPGVRIVRLTDRRAIATAWSLRKEALGLLMNVRGDHKPVAFIEDASVPAEHLADYIDALDRLLDATKTRAVMYAHASAGCLHVRPFINTKDAADVVKMRDLAAGSAELVVRFGGWVSSEHGDGIVRSWLNPRVLGERLYEACREVKAVFDPAGLLNPGRVVDAPQMTEHLRTGPDYRPADVRTRLDFGPEGGFAGAVEQCNGNGACRKIGSGAMCPSFMATREEADSTRGRANVLRMALSGRIPELDDEAVHDVLDLCLQCKACKSECPSSVDMAKIKTEWLAGYWERHSPSIRTRLFAGMPRVARMVSGVLAPAANAVSATGPVRRLAARMLGLDPDRPLPSFARTPYARSGGRIDDVTDPANTVVLFADTFANFQYPGVAHAAERVLRAGGFTVIPVGDVCCGRTYLSKGFVGRAQSLALRAVDRLHPFVARGIPIVGLEPSCIHTLDDEFRAMIPGDPRTREVADAAVGFERFVARHAERFGRLDWYESPGEVHVHPHCHQKALGDADDVADCLRIAAADVRTIDAGCCGLAGSFGYEAEHAEISRRIAEDRLAPAVRSAGRADIVAPGTSCRSQIEDVTGRSAVHPAEWMAARLPS